MDLCAEQMSRLGRKIRRRGRPGDRKEAIGAVGMQQKGGSVGTTLGRAHQNGRPVCCPVCGFVGHPGHGAAAAIVSAVGPAADRQKGASVTCRSRQGNQQKQEKPGKQAGSADGSPP